ncbi:hypothetical protein [Persicitalea jodogahamensis]|uniref:Uncharacterized protein n=1 Tax=Persicitalea jodogahamensis TaxID=402147 RepID=A0A8J3D7T8_9BACT|nr:hypothetical protein [Persicitalea jodogahamensis]GHB62710.1 hypothetical protein GCM10007390_15680 [Persicitalea jodogahamensis]
MPSHDRAIQLIEKLVRNALSEEELNELLANIGQQEMTAEYSVILEKYFYGLLTKDQE